MWVRLKPEEGQIKKEKEKIRNKFKLSMGNEQKRLVNGVCYIGRNRNNSFKKEILREKLKKLKLDHLVDEVE